MTRVLIVDDEPEILTLLRRWIEPAGYEVIQAGSASEALRLATGDTPPAVVLADMLMPGGDGIELAEHLRTSVPEAAVVMVTGVYALDAAVGSMQAGVVDYVAKPFARDRLLDAVRRACAVNADRRAQAAIQHELGARREQVSEALASVQIQAATTVDALLAVIERRDPTSGTRARRIAEISVGLAVTLGLPEPRVFETERAALLHECDALALPASLLARITGAPTGAGDDAPTSAEIVDVASAYDAICWDDLSGSFSSADAVAAMSTDHNDLDPRVLAALRRLHGSPAPVLSGTRACESAQAVTERLGVFA